MWAAIVLLLVFAPSNFWGYLAIGFGAAIAGGIGGGIIGFGQVLALRRWLDIPASLGSFFSTVLASSSAVISGTLAGWWLHAVAGDLAGAIAGVIIYGLIFGLVQRPMLDYMSHHPLLWVPVNAVAAVVGAMAVLAAFDVSGGRRDMLQFRYAGLVYSLVVGIAFLWMTRETRKTMSKQRLAKLESRDDLDEAPYSIESAYDARADPGLIEIHEQRVYRVIPVTQDPTVDQADNADTLGSNLDGSVSDEENGRTSSDFIGGVYRVIS